MKHLKKIGKALKVVLLSLFYMDYQIAEESKLKVSKFKLAFVVLTITTILWIIVFYTFPEYYLIMGITLSAGWLGFIVVAIGKLSERKKPMVNPLEACHRLALNEGQKENKRMEK